MFVLPFFVMILLTLKQGEALTRAKLSLAVKQKIKERLGEVDDEILHLDPGKRNIVEMHDGSIKSESLFSPRTYTYGGCRINSVGSGFPIWNPIPTPTFSKLGLVFLGCDPKRSAQGKVSLTTVLIPLRITIVADNGNPVVFDPMNKAIPNIISSPIYNNASFPHTSTLGGQFLDSLQRCSFNLTHTDWHVFLQSPVVAPLVDLVFPSSEGFLSSGAGIIYSSAGFQRLSSFLDNYYATNVEKTFPANGIPIFVMENAFGFSWLGFHGKFFSSSFGTTPFIITTWLDTEAYGSSSDIAVLTHELAEVAFNPILFNNLKYPWSSVTGTNCEADPVLEVCDPLEYSEYATSPMTLNGVTYHIANSFFPGWFSGDATQTGCTGGFTYPVLHVHDFPATLCYPTILPTPMPSISLAPSATPSFSLKPSASPTFSPSTAAPTTSAPTFSPSTEIPTATPSTTLPTFQPTTNVPTATPSEVPTLSPSEVPGPTTHPTSDALLVSTKTNIIQSTSSSVSYGKIVTLFSFAGSAQGDFYFSAFFAEDSQLRVAKIDGKSNALTILAKRNVDPSVTALSPPALSVGPDRLYVLSVDGEGKNDLVVFDLRQGNEVQRVSILHYWQATPVLAAPLSLWVAGDDLVYIMFVDSSIHSVSPLNPTDTSLHQVIPVLEPFHGNSDFGSLTGSSNGRLFATLSSGDSVWEIDLTTKPVTSKIIGGDKFANTFDFQDGDSSSIYSFRFVTCSTFDSRSNSLFLFDSVIKIVIVLDVASLTIFQLAGRYTNSHSYGDGGPAQLAYLGSLGGFAWDDYQNLLFLDHNDNFPFDAVRMVSSHHSRSPSAAKTRGPTTTPFIVASSLSPSASPSTSLPNSDMPSIAPSNLMSANPTFNPSASPTTAKPTTLPTAKPTGPTATPTVKPSASPTTAKPTALPTDKPTKRPTATPTDKPTARPTVTPTVKPSASPTTAKPTALPTDKPTKRPTATPTDKPTARPTATPTVKPSASPTTAKPTALPTDKPSPRPSQQPTARPVTSEPSVKPSFRASM